MDSLILINIVEHRSAENFDVDSISCLSKCPNLGS